MRFQLGVFLAAIMLLCSTVFNCAVSQEPEPTDDKAVLELGARIYQVHCRTCHFPEGKSPIKRLKLADDEWLHGGTLPDIQTRIADGIEGTQMMPFKEKLSLEEITAVAKYVKDLSRPGRDQATCLLLELQAATPGEPEGLEARGGR